MECETPVLNSHSGSVLGLISMQDAMPKAAEHLIHSEDVHHGFREQNKKTWTDRIHGEDVHRDLPEEKEG